MAKSSANIGVYLCAGCSIGDSIDLSALEKIASGRPSVKKCHVLGELCTARAHLQINDEINQENLDAIVLAGCSPRHSPTELIFSDIHSERVNLREGVAWVMEASHEDTQSAAEDYLQMGLARIESTGKPDPYKQEESSDEILVIGGGITGMQAALYASSAGYPVRLVEKSSRLGGWLNEWHDIIPSSGSSETNLDLLLAEKREELDSKDNITLEFSSEVDSIEGEPGNFSVSLRDAVADSENGQKKFVAGSIVLANGWKPYDPQKLTYLGIGQNKNIITQADLEKMAGEGNILRPSDGKVPENTLFIQCAGSRSSEHLPYCSNVCCLTSLKQALYIRRKYPESNVFIVYRDIRTPGKSEHFYKEVQADNRIFLIKAEISGVEKLDGDLYKVGMTDTILGKDISVNADMVVAATGMEPNQSEDLHLLYRKGEGLPERKYGFPDSHFICFPYETQRTGIYAAGAVRTPQGIQSCMEDASGAVVKAIQCIEAVKRGEAVHPRAGDQSYPDLYMQRCTDCKRCTEECPFGSYDETEKGTPLPNPARCRRCGICMGSCPERIINFDNYSINAVSEMIKSIPIPDEFEEKPRILAFVCENDAYPAFDMAALHRHRISPWLRIIPVRCIGSINKIWISDALSAGYDGILQIGCKPGDDYQCHFISGSELMETRSENLQETLQTMMLEPERVETVFLEIDDYHKIPEILDEYLETIEDIGPNPFKDM